MAVAAVEDCLQVTPAVTPATAQALKFKAPAALTLESMNSALVAQGFRFEIQQATPSRFYAAVYLPGEGIGPQWGVLESTRSKRQVLSLLQAEFKGRGQLVEVARALGYPAVLRAVQRDMRGQALIHEDEAACAQLMAG